MALTLMYITNSVEIAKIAQEAGVDRIWVDMEWIGKDERQKGLDTVKSHHTIEDIKKLRPIINKSQLMVRINPIHEGTCNEIEKTIELGADVIMLPMFKTIKEVKYFLNCIKGRVTTILLIETIEATQILDELIAINGIDEFYIGLNDLSLAMKKNFMFDLLRDGVVDEIVNKLKITGKPYGFGGIARLNKGVVPSEYIIAEHYRLGSTRAILSRSFCNANKNSNLNEVQSLFIKGIKDIRNYEACCLKKSLKDFEKNKLKIRDLINEADKTIEKK